MNRENPRQFESGRSPAHGTMSKPHVKHLLVGGGLAAASAAKAIRQTRFGRNGPVDRAGKQPAVSPAPAEQGVPAPPAAPRRAFCDRAGLVRAEPRGAAQRPSRRRAGCCPQGGRARQWRGNLLRPAVAFHRRSPALLDCPAQRCRTFIICAPWKTSTGCTSPSRRPGTKAGHTPAGRGEARAGGAQAGLAVIGAGAAGRRIGRLIDATGLGRGPARIRLSSLEPLRGGEHRQIPPVVPGAARHHGPHHRPAGPARRATAGCSASSSTAPVGHSVARLRLCRRVHRGDGEQGPAARHAHRGRQGDPRGRPLPHQRRGRLRRRRLLRRFSTRCSASTAKLDHWDNAQVTGTLAGRNMAGPMKVIGRSTISSAMCSICRWAAGAKPGKSTAGLLRGTPRRRILRLHRDRRRRRRACSPGAGAADAGQGGDDDVLRNSSAGGCAWPAMKNASKTRHILSRTFCNDRCTHERCSKNVVNLSMPLPV